MAQQFQVGEAVFARWQGGSEYKGRIAGVNADGTYVVHFNDGDKQNNVKPDHVRYIPAPGAQNGIFIVDQSTLYRVDPATGEYTGLNGNWGNARSMTYGGGCLFIIDGSSLYSVDPTSGDYTQLRGTWSDTKGMSYNNQVKKLFIVDQSTLYSVDPATGDYESMNGNWGGSLGHMASS